ncbi:MAG: hypothetical protein LBC27_00680 [Spirochaetaceae bacterium]|nr:hypothetical protein [Spirochaetaceae bacterium]
MITVSTTASPASFLLTFIVCAVSILIFYLNQRFRYKDWGEGGWGAHFAAEVNSISVITILQICLVYTAIAIGWMFPCFRELAGFSVYDAGMVIVKVLLSKLVTWTANSEAIQLLLRIAFAALFFWVAAWLLEHKFNMD